MILAGDRLVGVQSLFLVLRTLEFYVRLTVTRKAHRRPNVGKNSAERLTTCISSNPNGWQTATTSRGGRHSLCEVDDDDDDDDAL